MYSAKNRRDGIFFSHQFMVVSQPGAGKSTLATNISRSFTPPILHMSAGRIQRKFAKRLGMTIEVFAQHAREHPEKDFDKCCDKEIEVLARRNAIVIDAHLPVFAPRGFIILLVCDLAKRASRRALDKMEPIDKVVAELTERSKNDELRYNELYPGSLWPESDYDLVIDSGIHNPYQCLTIAMSGHRAWSYRNRDSIVTTPFMPLEATG